jgi:hypothetical protein
MQRGSLLLRGCLRPNRLFLALLRARTRRSGIVGKKLIPLEDHSHGEDN